MAKAKKVIKIKRAKSKAKIPKSKKVAKKRSRVSLKKKAAPKIKKVKKSSSAATLAKNETIARQFTEMQNQGNLTKLHGLLSPHFLSYISDEPHALSRDQFLEAIQKNHQAFSNLVIAILDAICHEDKVILRLIIRGKHTGNYQGIAPTYKEVQFAGITIRRIKEGKIFEEWQINDQLSLLKQLGCII